MNRAEAQELYNKYNGQAFFMAREEPDKYREFSRQYGFDHPDWDEELIRHGFDTLWGDPKHVWIRHHSILVTLRRGWLDPEYWGGRMLDEMEKMPAALDKQNRILILQNMAGENRDLDDGWVYLFCERPGLERPPVQAEQCKSPVQGGPGQLAEPLPPHCLQRCLALPGRHNR